MNDAYDHVSYLYVKMLPLFKQTKKDLKHLRRDLEYEQCEKEEMTIKFMEMKAIVDSYDSTLFDTMEIEFGKTKEKLASLELKNSRLDDHKQESVVIVSSLNDELSSLTKSHHFCVKN